MPAATAMEAPATVKAAATMTAVRSGRRFGEAHRAQGDDGSDRTGPCDTIDCNAIDERHDNLHPWSVRWAFSPCDNPEPSYLNNYLCNCSYGIHMAGSGVV